MSHPPKLTQADLNQFTGTERWFRHSINRNVLYTEGVQFLAERASAYWLLDDIAIAQLGVKSLAREPFQAWKLKVHDDQTATLRCEDGNYNLLHCRDYAYTDFPLSEVTLWVSGGVIYLPSEH